MIHKPRTAKPITVQDKSNIQINIFLFLHEKVLSEGLLISTNNMFLSAEVKKYIYINTFCC